MMDRFVEQTQHALSFLKKLEEDQALADRCRKTDLQTRLKIAAEMGLSISEENLRDAVRGWDYHGIWNKWLFAGRMDETLDDLPDLSEPYTITEDQCAAYRRDGYIVLRGVASKTEVEAYRPVFRGGVSRYNTSIYGSSADRSFLQIINLRTRDAAARRFIQAQRFAKIAADLLGVDAVRVYLDQALYKEAGGKTTHWHQDSLYFPLDTNQVVSMWMPLVDVTREMGTMIFASGSHTDGYLGYQPISEGSDEHFQTFVDQHGFTLTEQGNMSAGDVSFHNGWTLHTALPNTTDTAREAMVVVYYPADTRILKPANAYQERAMTFMFRGPQPGDVAESPINPVVYSAQ